MSNVTLVLADPTTRVDGTSVTAADCKGINIYRANGSAAATLVGTADPTATPPTFVDNGLTPGSYGYSVTAVDSLGRESAHSDVFPVVIVAPPALLNAPTIVSDTVA